MADAVDVSKVWATPEDMNNLLIWIKNNAAKTSDLDVGASLETLGANEQMALIGTRGGGTEGFIEKSSYRSRTEQTPRDLIHTSQNYAWPSSAKAVANIVDNVHIRGNSERFEYEYNMTDHCGKPYMYDIETEDVNV